MARTNCITVTASNVRESECLEGGRDVDIEVTIATEHGPVLLGGEVTLTPDTINGGWTSYGDAADTWVEATLLRALSATVDSGALRDALGEIRAEAVRAVEREGR